MYIYAKKTTVKFLNFVKQKFSNLLIKFYFMKEYINKTVPAKPSFTTNWNICVNDKFIRQWKHKLGNHKITFLQTVVQYLITDPLVAGSAIR